MSYAVVDASLAVKWALLEEYSGEAAALLLSWEKLDIKPVAPSCFACEMANVLFQRFRQGTVRAEHARSALVDLLRLVSMRDYDPGAAIRAFDLACDFGQRATYDAQYLALAEQLDCDLWTADERFWNAAKAAFPRVRWIGETTGASINSWRP